MKLRVGRKQIDVNMNIIDRYIAWKDPVRGKERMQARMQMALINAGGYDGAKTSRRSMAGWTTRNTDADGAILSDLSKLRERSRDHVRNNSLVAGAVSTKVANVIGTGLVLNSIIDNKYLGITEEAAAEWQANTEREFCLWANSTNCDIERTLNFSGLQQLAFTSVFEGGDTFAILPFIERPGTPYTLAIQLIEADRCSNPDGKPNSDKIAGGVEKDDQGAPVAYHFSKRHPGSINTTSKPFAWDRVVAFGASTGRRNVLHLFHKKRIGQTRGVPELAPVIESLRQLGDYTDAELQAAAISALFTVFVKTEGGAGLGNMGPTSETGVRSTDTDMKMAAGAIIDLDKDEDVAFADPSRPNANYDPFVMSILRQIGVALELPFELLIMHFTASYSASRAAILQAWKFFRMRRQWLIDNFCKPIYEEWLTEAVLLGRIAAPGFLFDPAIRAAYCGCEWIGPSMGQIDPEKEARANVIMVQNGWKTDSEVTAEMTGGDWETKFRQRIREQAMKKEAGFANPAPGSGGNQDNNNPDDETDKGGDKDE